MTSSGSQPSKYSVSYGRRQISFGQSKEPPSTLTTLWSTWSYIRTYKSTFYNVLIFARSTAAKIHQH
ncbi:hypothetical protein PISMIDRAFT_271608 [Pisolithus microcarpus 441]|uniref:Uncharacterized protein n=1 Tax=Pisolithus microcarpus 441 TaxID=765257 RepID=A0A0C9ZVP5_9AGAM|nr:hypothetical protein PISMIDRAFT_271608 [Pisolithus microcarpus 441]